MVKDLTQINEDFESFSKSLDSKQHNLELLRKGYEFAKKAHLYQKRASGEPYILHPLEVAKIVASLGLDDASILGAFLHDVVEDTEITLEDIEEEFGSEIAIIVDGLTKITHFGRQVGDVEKKIETLRKILLSSSKDIRILIIKLSDRLHNMRTLESLPLEKQEMMAEETLMLYVPIAQKMGMYNLKWELEELAFKFKDPIGFSLVEDKMGLTQTDREQLLKRAVEEMKSVVYSSGNHKAVVMGRIKTHYSIFKKIKDKAKDIQDIFDIYAIRIIVPDVSECYMVLGILHEYFQVVPDRVKDYIANPKTNGYQSLHTGILSPSLKIPIEIQIRTEKMHKVAEFGVAAHWRYKELKDDKVFEKKLSWLREVLEWEKEHSETTEFLKLLKFNFFEDEIFVFTPKNEAMVLPEGSCVLDFAYAVHTEIGHKAIKAKVNGHMMPLETKIKNGDIIEIITSPYAKPSEKYLPVVRTWKARNKIKHQLNLKHFSGSTPKVLSEGESFEILKTHMTRIEEFSKVRKPGCCMIEYGDQLVGVIKDDYEIVIHNASCENAKYTHLQKIPISWKNVTNAEVTLFLTMKDRYGLLMDILSIFSQFNLNVSKLQSKVLRNGDASMSIALLDGPYIEEVAKKLKELEGMISVGISRGFFKTQFYKSGVTSLFKD